MAAKRDFRFRRKIADIPAIAARRCKGGFGITDLVGKPLHPGGGKWRIRQDDTCGIAAMKVVGESRDTVDMHGELQVK
ncbi:hypothetical protein GCM10009125_28290 [Castellaniella daejeonensis]|uniref:Uncharacterized protein n=1 Tax=Castellaniella daejeonensis TaxID=659013 RepID=A0ABP3DNP9_9BURK